MKVNKAIDYIKSVLENMPPDWLNLTTHRLDIYDEKLAKTQFLEHFEVLFNENKASASVFNNLPTAYDYIRLGHPLSCVLEWVMGHLYGLTSKNVISFSSNTMPILAVLRENLLLNRHTKLYYSQTLPVPFDIEKLRAVYGYKFDVEKIEDSSLITKSDATQIYISNKANFSVTSINENIDFCVDIYNDLGSVLLVNGKDNEPYISKIQHVRRRETIAMTPYNCHVLLNLLTGAEAIKSMTFDIESDKKKVQKTIKTITKAKTKALVGSSGLSMQYAIMMGAINEAQHDHEGKAIKFVVPPNCYGGTNDQARRIAACMKNVTVVDLPVDGDNDMVKSVDIVLDQIAKEDAVAYIIAEIPTNPRVEVPNLVELEEVLSKNRYTLTGKTATQPVFILDQTFCPNVDFLSDEAVLSSVKTIAYVSGSKFPSGGKCTAGYCVGNKKANTLIAMIDQHLTICNNEANHLQFEILAKQLPSMKQRILEAYKNTRDFVNFIEEVLPDAKLNFVSETLAEQGFTPSVFSLDLPTKGNTKQEREVFKRQLNQKLIDLMITKIPDESKYCVSYGQLSGCYWTIPATSTQGTTKETDKDYIARVSLSPNMNIKLHKHVFLEFVNSL